MRNRSNHDRYIHSGESDIRRTSRNRTYCRIVTALSRTIELQGEIDVLYPEAEREIVSMTDSEEDSGTHKIDRRHRMIIQRRYAPIRGHFEQESVAGLTGIAT